MAKNIDYLGAIFPDVPSVKLPQQGGGLVAFDDTTDATATADKILQGYTAYANGQKLTGTASGGITPSGTISITQNGTVDVTQYASADVNVSGGGGGDATLVAEKNVAISTTSTVAVLFDTITVNKSELDNKAVFIDIQDTNGPRAGYFYGWQTCKLIKSTTGMRGVGGTYYKSSNLTATGFGTASNGAYGVYASIKSNASAPDVYGIEILGRYDSSKTTTIDGLFKVRIITVPAVWT